MKIFAINSNGYVGMREEFPSKENTFGYPDRIWHTFQQYTGNDNEGLLKELNTLNTSRDYYIEKLSQKNYYYETYTKQLIDFENWLHGRVWDIVEKWNNPFLFPATLRLICDEKKMDDIIFFRSKEWSDSPRRLKTEQDWKKFAEEMEYKFLGFNSKGNFFELEFNF